MKKDHPPEPARARTAREIASYDQGLAASNRELDRLIAMLRDQTGKFGEIQGLSNMALELVSVKPVATVGLLIAALKRLSDQPATGKETRS